MVNKFHGYLVANEVSVKMHVRNAAEKEHALMKSMPVLLQLFIQKMKAPN
jgi:hypothetical protein